LQNTRATILNLIQSRQSETVASLSEALDLAPATVRRHLDILQRDGLVTFTEVRHGTGRPEHQFRLTESGHETLPKDYDSLLSDLVGELSGLSAADVNGKSGQNLLDNALERIARRAAAPYRSANGRDPLRALKILLEEQDYAPEIEATESGARITLNNCPFRAVAKENPAICAYDVGLITGVLDGVVTRETCIRFGTEFCVYETKDTVVADTGS
jgi:predicted ArsR family transcriptional regulator